MPPDIKENDRAKQVFDNICKRALSAYQALIEMGIKPEDARYIIPMGVKSRILVTMNARSLRNFFRLRTCQKAQWEIRTMAEAMLEKVKDVAPDLFADSGPPCLEGRCPEGDLECYEKMTKKLKKEKENV